MSKAVELYCSDCGSVFNTIKLKCDCGGMIETRYRSEGKTSKSIDITTTNFYERFWDFLPIRDLSNIVSNFSLDSPTIKSTKIQQEIGGPSLWLKNETILPTMSTKDRIAAVVYPFLLQFGIKEIVLSSTGNSSTSMAAMAKYFPQMTVHIFIGKDFIYRLRYITSNNVKVHIVNENFVETGKIAKQFAEKNKLFWEGGFFNPARRDGLKTAYLEAIMDIGESPSYYVQAVSSAMGVVGTYKGASELLSMGIQSKRPKLICVQQASCAPMTNAWLDESPYIKKCHIVQHPVGIAKSILRGDPTNTYPILYRLVKESGGTFAKVTDEEIIYARRLLYECEGIWGCEASACALAGYIKLVKNGIITSKDGPVLINLTGGDRNELH